MKSFARAARALAFPTLALLAVAVFEPGRLSPAVRIYALLVCSVALALALRALRRAYPATLPLRAHARPGSDQREPPPTLARLERHTLLGVGSAFDFHYRLAPRLSAIAADLLSWRRRVSLRDEPEKAARILGHETFDLVRRDRPIPDDRLGPGVAPSTLRRVVESLERL